MEGWQCPLPETLQISAGNGGCTRSFHGVRSTVHFSKSLQPLIASGTLLSQANKDHVDSLRVLEDSAELSKQ
jgi:hypothetical protein